MKIFFLFLAFCSSASMALAQDFINGSFELNSVTDCQYNISNSSFNALMSNVRGIGDREMLDIFYDTKCSSFGTAQDGHYYCDVENPVDFYIPTALSLELTAPLTAGKSYTFSYYDKGTSNGGGAIEFGVSANNSSFGTAFHMQPDSSTTAGWIKRTIKFTAPLSGKYITVRYGEIKDSYILIDHFVFEKSASISENNIAPLIALYPNPAVDELTISTGPGFEQAQNIRIINPLGQVVSTSAFIDKLDVSALASGIYLLQIKTAQQSYSTTFYKQ